MLSAQLQRPAGLCPAPSRCLRATGSRLLQPAASPAGLHRRRRLVAKADGQSVNVAAVEEKSAAATLKLEPAICIVTGSGRGIGAATALALAEAGCKVAINYSHSSEAAEQVAAQVKELGGEALLIKADMGKHQEIEAMVKQVADHWGGLEVLVNNAGITRDKLMMQMKPEDWQAVIDVNLSGVFYASQAAAKVMGKKKKGRIISLASVVGQIGNAGQANYSAAKGGVIAMTKTIAREYAGRGITANSVAPGFIDTAMTGKIPDNIKAELLKGIPLGRMGDPKEVAGLVRYLALDPSAAYITGQCIGINGGMAM